MRGYSPSALQSIRHYSFYPSWNPAPISFKFGCTKGFRRSGEPGCQSSSQVYNPQCKFRTIHCQHS